MKTNFFGCTRLLTRVASSIVFYLSIAGISNAALVSLEISGHVGSVVGNPFGFNLAGGEPFSASFTYDTATSPAYPRTDQTYYIQTTSYTVTVAGHQLTGDDWFVFMSNDTFGDFFELSAGSNPAGFGTVDVDGIPNPDAGFTFGAQDTSGTVFTSVALPVSPFPPLSAFDVTNIGLFSDNSLGPRAATFNVTLTRLIERSPIDIDALCPCAGPVSGGTWKSHGQYLSCVAKAANALLKEGLLMEDQAEAIVETAAQSACGKH
jgi:hypothetical protein